MTFEVYWYIFWELRFSLDTLSIRRTFQKERERKKAKERERERKRWKIENKAIGKRQEIKNKERLMREEDR